MNRAIKFRGRKTSTGEWLKGSLIINENGNHTICQISYNPVHKGVIQGWCFGVDPDTVGQFTGLQDRNGADIYEGDIARDGDGNILVISWSEKFASFSIYKNGWVFTHWFGESYSPQDIEVIGNIHEHKHLLS